RLIEDFDLDVLLNRRPVGELHRDVLIIVQNSCPNHLSNPLRHPEMRVQGHLKHVKSKGKGGISRAAACRAWPARRGLVRACNATRAGRAAPRPGSIPARTSRGSG